jgi:hypothetical protein
MDLASPWLPVVGHQLAEASGKASDLGLALLTANDWPAWWVAGTGYADADLVLTQDASGHYELWRAVGAVAAGAVPGTDPAWERIDVLSRRLPDPTGVPVGHVLKMTASGPKWAAP